ncbi:M48 family metallopeptidase [Piscinibacterium candidicorallinum]|uniref:M48 family metallopeptidase n=1 Tax=Piscinibacterium candidicorallinum TaxID=1793872 RepID=A0ABV7H4C6_9BURK
MDKYGMNRRAFCLGCAGLFCTGAFAQQNAPAQGDGVQGVGERSRWTKLVSAAQVEKMGAQQFAQMTNAARTQGALLPRDHPQTQRLDAIAKRMLPFAPRWNDRARQWPWEVQVFNSPQINAFCMPGGKIGFYTGILDKLKLTDDEVGIIMGHEVAHALREHARERLAKQAGMSLGASAITSIFGLGDLGRLGVDVGANLLANRNSREDETEADVVGLDLASRAGFDPRAGVVLWQKMALAAGGSPPQWLSTHPAGENRIAEIKRRLPQVMPLYAQTRNTTPDKLPPYTSNFPNIPPVSLLGASLQA